MFLQCLSFPPNNQVQPGAQLESARVTFVRRHWRNTDYQVYRLIYTLINFNNILKNCRSNFPEKFSICENWPPSFSCCVLIIYKGKVHFPQCTAHGGLAVVRRFSCLLVEDGWSRWMEQMDGGVGWMEKRNLKPETLQFLNSGIAGPERDTSRSAGPG